MMTGSFPRELGFMKECIWERYGKVHGLIPDCRTLIDRVKSCINNKNNELPILLHSLFKPFQWLSLTLWMKSQILTRPLMYALPDLDAGYSSDSHTGLYILEYVKHNTNTTASFFCVFAIISAWYSLSPYIVLAFSLPVFFLCSGVTWPNHNLK